MAKITDVTGAERRRDRRRANFIKASLNGQPITILDVSLGGVGGTIELRGDPDALPGVGEMSVLEINPEDAPSLQMTVEIRRCDLDLNIFGAHVVEMGDTQFRALERLSMGRDL